MTGPVMMNLMQKIQNMSQKRKQSLLRKRRGLNAVFCKYVVAKRWVNGERAEMDEDVIKVEVEGLMREFMELS